MFDDVVPTEYAVMLPTGFPWSTVDVDRHAMVELDVEEAWEIGVEEDGNPLPVEVGS